jgi:hypothetical protein
MGAFDRQIGRDAAHNGMDGLLQLAQYSFYGEPGGIESTLRGTAQALAQAILSGGDEGQLMRAIAQSFGGDQSVPALMTLGRMLNEALTGSGAAVRIGPFHNNPYKQDGQMMQVRLDRVGRQPVELPVGWHHN